MCYSLCLRAVNSVLQFMFKSVNSVLQFVFNVPWHSVYPHSFLLHCISVSPLCLKLMYSN